MRIGILETGTPPAELVLLHGRYDAMVHKLLGDAHEYVTFRVFAGERPSDIGSFDALFITGSSAGVNDGLPWVDDLAAFLRRARGQVKLVGICFGHQIMAHAFGGVVAKAAQGWGLGLHRYELRGQPAWVDAVESVAVIASHQDQVVTVPPGAVVFGSSAFTPHAMIDHGNGAISFQCHPEFTPPFAGALIDAHSAPDLSADDKAAAHSSLTANSDAAIVGHWINRFLQT